MNVRKFRVLIILETGLYGAFLIAYSIGGFIGNFPTLYPFKPKVTSGVLFYCLFAVWIVGGGMGIYFQLKKTVADPKEVVLTVNNVFGRATDGVQDDGILMEGGKKEGSWNIFGGSGDSKPARKEFVELEDDEVAERKRKAALQFSGGFGDDFSKSGADDFGKY